MTGREYFNQIKYDSLINEGLPHEIKVIGVASTGTYTEICCDDNGCIHEYHHKNNAIYKYVMYDPEERAMIKAINKKLKQEGE